LGLPVQWSEFVKNPRPRFPINDLSYEAYDPKVGQSIEGVFVAGWSRAASSGLVGYARKDGETGAEVALSYLEEIPAPKDTEVLFTALAEKLVALPNPIVDKDNVVRLLEIEDAQAKALGVVGFKFDTNQAMLEALG